MQHWMFFFLKVRIFPRHFVPQCELEKKGIFIDVLPQRGSIILAIPSHKSTAFYPSLRQGNEPGAKVLPSEGLMFVEPSPSRL